MGFRIGCANGLSNSKSLVDGEMKPTCPEPVRDIRQVLKERAEFRARAEILGVRLTEGADVTKQVAEQLKKQLDKKLAPHNHHLHHYGLDSDGCCSICGGMADG